MRKYFIYARKSSESEDRQVLSIDSQIAELKELAQKLNLDIIEPVYKESQSAKEPGRPKFDALMQRILAGEAQGIVCWKLDRLARNPIDGGKVIWAIKQSGIDIVTPSQTFNQQNENTLLMYMEFGVAQKFVDDLSKNVKRGLNTKAEKGWLPSGAKAGYMNDKYAEKGSKTILPDPDRFPLIRKAWDAMLTGTYSVIEILRLLNSEWGYQTPKHKRIGGKPMSRSQIYKTLTDPFYYGEFEYPTGSGIWRQGKHEPMITRDEFDKVQRLLGRKGRPRPRTRSFDYTGLLECGECHAMITAEEKFQIICPECKHKFASQNKSACPKCQVPIEEMKNPTLLHYVYYHCTKRKDPNCTQKSVRVEKLDKEIDKTLARLQISERFKDWAIKYLNELNDKESEDNVSVLKFLQSANEDIETRLNNLLKLKISPQNADGGLLSDEDYRAEKERLGNEKKKISEKLGGNNYQAEHWRETAEKTFDFACHARYWFANGDRQTKREILAGLGSNLELYDRSVRINLEKPLQFIELAMNEEPTIAEMFEPKESIDNTVQMEYLWSQNLSLLPRVDSNHEP
ncbi:MAG TPA: recombinase family protein [Patescibacteria group bacterium]|nr:recombinase family protein [Patescibacteria group bacterium]